MKEASVCTIQLLREKKEIQCIAGKTILDTTLGEGINHFHACGGQDKCTTCRVCVSKGIENCEPRNKAEQKIADQLNFPPEIRLACQTKINGSIAIRRMVLDQLDQHIVNDQFSYNSEIAIGNQQELTILFTDIVNYTSFAEKFPPYDIVHILNRYYRTMNKVIVEHDGFISDIAGDGILAIFGKDHKSENSVLDAVSTVRIMHEKITLLNEYLQENYDTQFGIRAGIHFGKVILGPFDTGLMKKIGVIGDNVNYASRIESANKEFGTSLLLSEEAYKKVRTQYPNHNAFQTTLKGKTGVYDLFEILFE